MELLYFHLILHLELGECEIKLEFIQKSLRLRAVKHT